MVSTLLQVRQRILERGDFGFVIPNTFLDSITSTGIVSQRFFNDTNKGANDYSSVPAGIYRPQADNDADKWRWAGELKPKDSILEIAGDSYSDLDPTDEYIELWYYGLQPDIDVLNAIQNAQEKVGTRLLLPLTLVPNGGFYAGTSGWTGNGSATPGVGPAILQGRQSGRVTNTGPNGLMYSDPFPVTSGAQLYVAALGVGDLGTNVTRDSTALFVAENVTAGNSAFYNQTFTSKRPALPWKQPTVPSGCKEMRIGLGGVEADAVTRWDSVFVYQTQDGRLFLPSGIQEAWEFEALTYMRFSRSLQTSGDVYDAMSVVVDEVPRADYQVSDLPADEHTPIIQFNSWNIARHWMYYPLTIQARPRDSSFNGGLQNEDDITAQPLDMLASAAIIELLDAVSTRIPGSEAVYRSAWEKYNAAVSRRGANGPAKRKPAFYARWIG